jgi:hypothetical protein
MRKRKTITIDKKEITVLELRVKDAIEIYEEIESGKGLEDLREQVEKFLPRATDINVEALKEFAPSELKELYEAFKEVNAVFFEAVGSLGLGSLLSEIKKAILKDFANLCADLLKPGISEPSSTDIPSS